MAKKTRPPIKRVVTEFVPREEEVEELPLPIVEQDEAESSFENFVRSFPQEGVVIKINRQTENGKQYCFRAEPHEMTDAHERLRLYHAKQPYRAEVGNYFLEIFVNGEPRTTFPVSIAPQVDASSTGGIAASGPSDIVRLLMDQNARLEQRLLQVQHVDREPIGQLADAMLKLQQIQGSQKSELPIDTVMKCIELGKELNTAPSEDWKSWLMPILKESLPVIQGIVAANRPAAAPQLAAGPVPQQQEVATVSNEDQMMRAGIAYLKQKCLNRSHPGLYVDLVYDNKDNPQYAAIIRRVLAPGAFSEFASNIDPEIGKPPFDQFFQFFFDGLRSAFAEENPLDDNSGGTAGNTANAPSNGSASKAGSKKS